MVVRIESRPPARTSRRAMLDAPAPARKTVDKSSLPTRMAVTNLDLDVTENCNLGCVYCFKGEKTPSNMSLDTAKQSLEWLLDAARDAPRVNVNFMGGEPTMRWALIEAFVPWARRRGRSRGKMVTFSMTSNLTLWTEQIRSFVDRWGFGVLMSIDGCPDVQDSQRPTRNGRPASEIIGYWARSLLKTRPRSMARATLHPDWTHKLLESMTYLRSLGFTEVALSASEYEAWTEEAFTELEQRQLPAVVDMAVRSFEDERPFNITVFKYAIKELVIPRRAAARPRERHHPCGAGRGMAMIDDKGDVWPCHRFDGADADANANGQFRLANIFEPGFNTPLHEAFIHYDHMRHHKHGCSSCPVSEVCGGYCPAANLSSTTSLYTPHDNYCRWSAIMYRAAEELFDRLAADNRAHKLLLASVDDVDGAGGVA